MLLVMKSLHGISPIIDGRHSFGCVPAVGEEEGDSWCLCLAPANGCGMTAIRAMARKKAMWHLDVAMDLFFPSLLPGRARFTFKFEFKAEASLV